jgi:hypothetical protein
MSLKKKLFCDYGGFADKRVKNLSKSDVFIADDRTERDRDARKQLFYWFCEILVRVVDDDVVEVDLRGGVPISPEVSRLLADWNSKATDSRVVFRVGEESTVRLDSFAKALRNIVAPGKRYSTSWYKHICPRTADSLLRLKQILDDYWTNPPKGRPLKDVPLIF